ncbi:MAG: hypothetical protein HFE90_00315 [Firmicutes bacterium]|nr:hypothetical protein [Bacillota bacterium]
MDNWDFTNPVNQRGQSIYITDGYSIDRWILIPGHNLEIKSDCVRVNALSSNKTEYGMIIQRGDNVEAYKGKTVTLSLMYRNLTNINNSLSVALYDGIISPYANAYQSSGIIHITTVISQNADQITIDIGNAVPGLAFSADLLAIKLELGSVSTLKNDLLGMSYDKELYKCQKYLQIIRNESNNEYVTIFDSVPWQVTRDFIAYRLIRPMRKTPVLTYVNIRAQTANGYFYPINIYIEQDDTIISEDVPLVKLRIESADNTNYPLPNEAYLMNIGAKGYIMFSADL